MVLVKNKVKETMMIQLKKLTEEDIILMTMSSFSSYQFNEEEISRIKASGQIKQLINRCDRLWCLIRFTHTKHRSSII